MSFCKVCGYEIKWRTIEGKKVPMGCRCDYGEYGEDQFFRDFAVLTRCPKCGDEVYFVRHNRGSVWFDHLGQPWPKHPCFDGPEQRGTLKQALKNRQMLHSGPIQKPEVGSGSGIPVFILKVSETDHEERFLYVSLDNHAFPILPEPSIWLHIPPPQVGSRILLDRNSSTIEMLLSKSLYRYRPVKVGRCGDCGRLYFNWNEHLEVCRNVAQEPS